MAKSLKPDSGFSSTKTLRLCHLSDLHLGYRRYSRLTKSGFNQREADVNAAFREAVTRIISLRPDAVLIAGDLFHAVRPSNAVIGFAFRELRRLAVETGAPVILIAGNHETPRRIDSGCVLRLFSEIEGVFVADSKEETFNFPELELSVTCLPHAALTRLDELRIRADDKFKHNVLCLHGQIVGTWMSDFGGTDVALNAISPHEWDYIALGHVHIRTPVGLNAAYSGAIEHTSTNIWSDAKEKKGFLEIELPGRKTVFHALTSPREVIVLPDIDARGLAPEDVTKMILERADEVPGGLDGKIVRLEVQNLPREVFRELDHREIRKIRVRALNFALEVRPPVRAGNDRLLNRAGRGKLSDELNDFKSLWQSDLASGEEVVQLVSKYLLDIEAQNEAA